MFLTIEGVRLSQKGFADDIHEEGFAPLKELMENFVKAGGKIYVCSPCFKKRKLDEGNLVAGATIVGGAKLVEFLVRRHALPVVLTPAQGLLQHEGLEGTGRIAAPAVELAFGPS